MGYDEPPATTADTAKAFERLTVPGWKSDIEKQIFRSGWKRPEGVSIYKAESRCQSRANSSTGIMKVTAFWPWNPDDGGGKRMSGEDSEP